MPLWVSVGGFSAAEYAETCAALDATDVAALELNLSCPNVDEAPDGAAAIVVGVPRRDDEAALREALAGALGHRRGARAAQSAGADGLSLVNTLRGLALDPRTLKPSLARGAGGYSGPALRPVALAAVHAAYRATGGMPIVGMGGVETGRARARARRGGRLGGRARHGSLRRPDAPGRVRAELQQELAALGVARLEDARGLAHDLPAPV